MKYCASSYQTQRRATRCVMVGNVGVGGTNPIRIQSMTTSNTRDVDATIDQIIRLADMGCDIARVTVQGMKEAEACEGIKNGLVQRGYTIPLVADIHFYPPAALRVADYVDKVRINPGNFVDKRATFKTIEYDDATYAEELARLDEKFSPLVEKCQRLKRAMRIGTNHGSLSDRILNRYGDTPRGMVESALEFARICRAHNYHDFLFSMKSSNPQVMVQAYRLLVASMEQLGWDYPLHLGVTEAGEGEDGRVKSAMGIGALLLDGIGDTIRVSLTEDPWYEIDPCQRLVRFYEANEGNGCEPFIEKHRDPMTSRRRPVVLPKQTPLHRDGSVFVAVAAEQLNNPGLRGSLGLGEEHGLPKLRRDTADALVICDSGLSVDQAELHGLRQIGIGVFAENAGPGRIPLRTLRQIRQEGVDKTHASRFQVLPHADDAPWALCIGDEPPADWEVISLGQPSVIFLNPTQGRVHACRRFFDWLQERQYRIPVILNFSYAGSQEDVVIMAAAECGALLCDGLGEGLCLQGPYDIGFLRKLSFTLLQAARMRTTRTDFISCPSCGRTLFNLQEVTARIRQRTAHLPGVKIAIMGCIVNGPGEMADADFGYVGSKPGKVDLYVGKKCVEKDIAFNQADDRLVALIKEHGRWEEPAETTSDY